MAGTSAALLVLALAAVFPTSLSAQALTYQQEINAATSAMLKTPGYTLFSKNLANITTLSKKYSTTKAEQRVTILAPGDAAIAKILSIITPTQAVINNIVAMHIIRASIPQQAMKNLPAGTSLATFNPAVNVFKVSAQGQLPLVFKTAKSTTPGTVLKAIYQGKYITIYAIDKAFTA